MAAQDERDRQQPMADAGQAAFDRRRRLLKAMAGAAPAVMTLPVGAQTAATSILCSAKPVSPAPPNVIAGTDGFVRKSVPVFSFKIQRNGSGTFDVRAWQINGQFYATEGQPNGYSVGTRLLIPGDREVQRTDLNTTNSLLYYVTPDGTSATAYPLNAGNGNPLSTSCWTSLAGGTSILG